MKVVERAGKRVNSLLPGLKEEQDCKRDNCMIHVSGGNGDCNKEGIVYKGQCMSCQQKDPSIESVYYGESSRSAYVRGKQHLAAIKDPKKHPNNAFAKHIREYHPMERDVKFEMRVQNVFKRPFERQVREGIEIYGYEGDILMNSKVDHYQPAVKRIIFTNQLRDIHAPTRHTGIEELESLRN